QADTVANQADIVADQAGTGWLVEEVDQVGRFDPADVDESPAEDSGAINGVAMQGGGDFVIWVDPRAVHAGS
ncbi:MAG: hypothetical protein V5A43_02240, partial [Haloarculaceae archaeon]